MTLVVEFTCQEYGNWFWSESD